MTTLVRQLTALLIAAMPIAGCSQQTTCALDGCKDGGDVQVGFGSGASAGDSLDAVAAKPVDDKKDELKGRFEELDAKLKAMFVMDKLRDATLKLHGTRLDALEARADTVDRSIADIRVAMTADGDALAAAKAELEALDARLDSEATRLDEALDAKIADVSAQLEALAEETAAGLAALDAADAENLAMLQAELDAARAEREALAEMAAADKAELLALIEDLGARLEEAVSSLEDSDASLYAELIRKTRRLDREIQAVAFTGLRIAFELQRQILSLRSDMESADAALRADMKKRLKKLESDFASEIARLDSADADLLAAHAALAGRTAGLEAGQSQLAKQLTAFKKAQELVNTVFGVTIGALAARVETVKRGLEGQIEAVAGNVDLVRVLVDGLSDGVASLAEQSQILSAQLRLLEDQAAASAEDIARLESEIQALEASLASEVGRIESQIEALEQTVDDVTTCSLGDIVTVKGNNGQGNGNTKKYQTLTCGARSITFVID